MNTWTGTGQTSEESVESKLAKAVGAGYEVRRLLGRGGFAEVFEVWDQHLERRLAIKVLRPDIAWTSGMLDRFRQEARAVARLNHPNILPIHFVGEGEGIVYYAMPFVEGRSLGDLLRTRPALDADQAIELMCPILEALQHAHERGLVHRDIKPDNIMIDVTTGRPLLVDFGIVKQLDGGQAFTQTGFVVGTPQYMSPEQALGQGEVDARSDLYAVGAVLFQMVTGTPPFDGDTSQEIVAKHIAEPPPIPSSLNARIPKWLSDVIVRCLQKTPNERYQSAAMMLDAIAIGRGSGARDAVSAGRVVQQLQGEATALVASAELPAGAPVATRRRRGRRAFKIVTVLGGVAALGFAGWSFVMGGLTLVVDNRLVEPIRISVGGLGEQMIEPASVRRIKIERGPLTAQWSLVRPRSSDGVELGLELRGTLVDPRPARTVRIRVTASNGDTAYFAPLITNATDRPLEVIVNSGLVGETPCGCVVPAGTTRSSIGYYLLFGNSRVEVRDVEGRSAAFPDLGPNVDRESGVVGLRFETANLVAPARDR